MFINAKRLYDRRGKWFKKIAEKREKEIYEEIIKEAIAYGVGIINQEEIDRINILNATKKD